jgi:hypothetical protein
LKQRSQVDQPKSVSSPGSLPLFKHLFAAAVTPVDNIVVHVCTALRLCFRLRVSLAAAG